MKETGSMTAGAGSSRKKRAVLSFSLPSIPPAAITELVKYDWPGNIRELENVIYRCLDYSVGQDTLNLRPFDEHRQEHRTSETGDLA